MAQASDYTIDNSTGANVRADINTVLQAIATNNSGSSAASTTFASGYFANTSTSMMQLRNTANNDFINLFSLAGAPAFPIDGTINSINIGKGANSVSGNTVFGEIALDGSVSGSNNTAIGKSTLTVMTSGDNNTAVGSAAMDAVTSGSQNTGIGRTALSTVSTGNDNTALGFNALVANSTASNNTGLGRSALASNDTGANNVAVGNNAVDANVSSFNNTGVGYNALTECTGGQNSALGAEAGDVITTGSNNTCLGYQADPSANDATNEVVLGNSSVTALRCQVALTVLSDGRDKKNIIDLPAGLNFINTLKPRQFEWKTREGVPSKDGTVRAGFIAQELQEAQKGLEYLNLVFSNNPDKLEATLENLIPVLVKAVQELSAKVTALEGG